MVASPSDAFIPTRWGLKNGRYGSDWGKYYRNKTTVALVTMMEVEQGGEVFSLLYRRDSFQMGHRGITSAGERENRSDSKRSHKERNKR